MNVLSLFSGVGGFDLGLENAGMKTIYQCEWDKHATRILERHWPQVPRWGDISTLTGKEILSHGTPPDVVAWGSPCQDLSAGGKQIGITGERSSLFHEGIRIINELRKETNNEYPKISIWENVAGALSSNRGADFGVILDEMANAGAMVIEWGMLDAQYWLPQRRRRVFVIAIFNPATATNCPSPLLPLSESLSGNTKQGKSQRESSSSTSTECVRTDNQEQFITELSFAESSFGQFREGDVAALKASGGVLGGGSETIILTQPSMAVRRLTPLECERLMGWPDDHTRYNADGTEQADTHRYKQCGNGVASPVAEWIGKQLMKLDGAAQ